MPHLCATPPITRSVELHRSPSHPRLRETTREVPHLMLHDSPGIVPGHTIRAQLSRGEIAKLHQSELRNRPPVPPKSPRHHVETTQPTVMNDMVRRGTGIPFPSRMPPHNTETSLSSDAIPRQDAAGQSATVADRSPKTDDGGAPGRGATSQPTTPSRRLPRCPTSSLSERPLPPLPSQSPTESSNHKVKRKAIPSALADIPIPAVRFEVTELLRTPSPSPGNLLFSDSLFAELIRASDEVDKSVSPMSVSSTRLISLPFQPSTPPLQLRRRGPLVRQAVFTGDFTPPSLTGASNTDTFRRFSSMDLDQQLEEMLDVLETVGSKQKRWSCPAAETESIRADEVTPFSMGLPRLRPSAATTTSLVQPSTSVHSHRLSASADKPNEMRRSPSCSPQTISTPSNPAPLSPPRVPLFNANVTDSKLQVTSPRFIPSGRSFETVRKQPLVTDPRASALAQTEDISKIILRPVGNKIRGAIEKVVSRAELVELNEARVSTGQDQVTAPCTPVRGEDLP
jgi:hypothetical protein